MFRIPGEPVHPMVSVLTFAVGAAGGLIATVLGLPLPMLLGSVVAVGAVSILGLQAYGSPPKVPMWIRLFFLPIIGLAIGGAFTPQVLEEAPNWWPSLLALVVFIPLVHYGGFIGYSRFGGLEPHTAYYSAAPGGLIEVIQMGEEAGADVKMITLLQFMRLILTILLVPLAFSILEGAAVGSSSGVSITKADNPNLQDWVILVFCGAVGFFGGKLLRFPAYVITGPITMSGLAHLFGYIETIPPNWMVQLTQLVIGVALGTRFVGMQHRALWLALKLAFVNILGTMTIAVAMAMLLHSIVDERTEAVALAFAPGGLAEMSLVAVSLEISVVYVTAHHVLRIVLAIAVVKMFEGRVRRPIAAPPG